MSKRQQAPGPLEHVRALVNTLDREDGTDELTSPAALSTWLAERGLVEAGTVAGRADLRHALELREALRAALLANNDGSPVAADAAAVLDAIADRARVRLRFGADGRPRLRSGAAGVDAGLGGLLTIVHAAVADGTWARLKACRDRDCGWAFYDHTKNRSGAWCDMAVCGNRAKARSYRARRSPRR